jgi:hypothetical protein
MRTSAVIRRPTSIKLRRCFRALTSSGSCLVQKFVSELRAASEWQRGLRSSRRAWAGGRSLARLRSSMGGPRVIVSLLYWALRRLFEVVGLSLRSSAAKDVEIVVLRHQLQVVRRQVGRPQLRDHDRVLLATLARLLPCSSRSLLLVRPETVLGWHRKTGCETLDPPETRSRSPADRTGDAEAGSATRTREPALGVPAHPGRTDRPRALRQRELNPGHPPSRRPRTGAASAGTVVA